MKNGDKYLNITTDQMKFGDMFFVKIDSILSIYIKSDEIAYLEKRKRSYQKVNDPEKFQRTFYKTNKFVKLDNLYRNKVQPLEYPVHNIKKEGILLLQYVGNDEFLEYYTGIIVRYENHSNYNMFPIKKDVKSKDIEPLETWKDFYERYNEYLIAPLFIENGTLLSIHNDECARKFREQMREWQKIKKIIFAMQQEGMNWLSYHFGEIKKQDEKYAKEENMMRTLKRDAFNKTLEDLKHF